MLLETRRIFSTINLLNFNRVSNFLVIVFSEWIARWFKIIKLSSPYALTLELSSICNLKCPQCPVGLGQIKRQNAFIDVSRAKQIIDDFSKKGMILNLYFQGESTLHPDFVSILEHARKRKLYTILSTNATKIDDELATKLIQVPLNRVILSIDGLSQATYGQYRKGADVSIAWEALQKLTSIRKKRGTVWPEIVVQTLVNRLNEPELDKIKERALFLRADRIQFKTMQLYGDLDTWLPSQRKYRRYEERSLVKPPSNHCFRAFSSMVITSDGEFLPCCYDKLAAFGFNKYKQSFMDAVKNKARKKFLEKIYVEKKLHSICRNCPEGMRVYKKAGMK